MHLETVKANSRAETVLHPSEMSLNQPTLLALSSTLLLLLLLLPSVEPRESNGPEKIEFDDDGLEVPVERVVGNDKALPLDADDAVLDDDDDDDNVDAVLDDEDEDYAEGGGDKEDPVADRVVDAMMAETTKKGKDLQEAEENKVEAASCDFDG